MPAKIAEMFIYSKRLLCINMYLHKPPRRTATAGGHPLNGQADQFTKPLHAVASTTRPNAMRYQAKPTKVWVAM